MDSWNSTIKEESFSYHKLSGEFDKYHGNESNVLLHLITTPLGLLGLISLIRNYASSSSLSIALCTMYLVALLDIPFGDFIGTTLFCMALVQSARYCNFGVKVSIGLIVLGYCLQDLSHLATNERTLQENENGSQFLTHTYYLLPLCVHAAIKKFGSLFFSGQILDTLHNEKWSEEWHLAGVKEYLFLIGPITLFAIGSYCIDSRNSFCFFPGMPYFHRVLRCNLIGGNDSKEKDLKCIRDWVIAQKPAADKSTHWWYKKLDNKEKSAFDACAKAPQLYSLFRELFSERNYCMDVLEGMNEIYVTGPARSEDPANSDQVFYTRHVDGPWGFVPFVSVYRCIVGMDRNYMITTHFPIANVGVNACAGDVLAFDFNREVHYITCDESKKSISDDYRVVLKLHYAIYPRVLAPLGWFMGWLNTVYNKGFRALFLMTINPVTLYQHFLAWNVNFQTVLFDRIETYIGQRSIYYLVFVAAMWYVTGVYEFFLLLTSFNHYIRYISTFYVRRGIDFGSFKRDVLLFKTIALIQVFYQYFEPLILQKEGVKFNLLPQFSGIVAGDYNLVSILMIVSGYFVSAMATKALGIDRTYFGAELGLVEEKWVTEFPYNCIPHPMILSQVWALSGILLSQHIRISEYWYLIPIHITLYVIHALQEHFQVYKTYPNEKIKKEKVK